LANEDSGGGEKSTVLMSSKKVRKGIEIRQLFSLDFQFENHTSLQKVKNMNHSMFPSFYFGAKNGSPEFGMATRS